MHLENLIQVKTYISTHILISIYPCLADFIAAMMQYFPACFRLQHFRGKNVYSAVLRAKFNIYAYNKLTLLLPEILHSAVVSHANAP